MTSESKKELLRTIKFTLFSLSAGAIQLGSYALMEYVLHWPAWISYLIALVLSVVWNFTLNRRFTFQSANNVPKAMFLVFLFYLVFTPLSTMLEGFLTAGIALPWAEDKILLPGIELVPGIVATILNMVLNFVLEFLYDRFVVFRDSIDTNELAKKQEKTEEE